MKTKREDVRNIAIYAQNNIKEAAEELKEAVDKIVL